MNGIASTAFGLAAATAWGVADFSGGIASRRYHLFGVLIVSQGMGLLFMASFALVSSEPFPALSSLGYGVAAGLAAAVGGAALYQALSVGQMGVASPVTAVLVAAVPVLFGAFRQGLPSLFQFSGLGVGMVALWLISRPEASRVHWNITMALLAGLGFGVFLVLLSQAGTNAVFWTLSTVRGISLLLMLGISVLRRQGSIPSFRALPLTLLAGTLDVTGSVFFMLAVAAGRLDIAAVLSSLYPVATALLARQVLRERVTRTQGVGIAAALVAVSLIAIG